MKVRKWIVALALATAAARAAIAQCEYEVTLLDYPIDCSIASVITSGIGMNNNGAVVGRWQCPIWYYSEAFLWTPEDGFTSLQRPAGVNGAVAADINDQGVICGDMVMEGGGYRGFVYDDGVWTELPAVTAGGWSYANGISNSGVVAGKRGVSDGPGSYTAFIWSASRGFLDLGPMSTGNSTANGISNSGCVVGMDGDFVDGQAFLWYEGTLQELGAPVGTAASWALGINESRIVVGGVMLDPVSLLSEPARWRHGNWQLFGLLEGCDNGSSAAINAFGACVGTCADSLSNFSRGFLWQNGNLYDLNDLVPAGTPVLRRAKAINDNGQILAYNGRTYLLTPVGRPLGDIDIDCRVGITDFLFLLAHWGEGDSSADLDDDGTVGLSDLVILLENWG